jgi:MFS family permease
MNEETAYPSTTKQVFSSGSPTWVRWRIVVLLMALSFVSWFNRVNLPTAYAERIKDTIGISENEIGAVSSLFLLIYAVFMTPGGWFSDRYGTRLSLGIMGIGLGVFAALTGGAGVLFQSALPLLLAFFVIRCPMGVIATPMYPAGSRTIAHWFPFARRSSANGLVQGAAMLGIAMTPPLFGRLMDRCGWPGAFLIAGIGTATVGLLWMWYARNYPVEHSGVNDSEMRLIHEAVALPERKQALAISVKDLGPWRDLLRNRSLVLLTIAYAAVGYFEYLFNFWTQYYFKYVREVPTETSRNYTMVTSLSMGVGMFLGGGLADIFVRRFGIRLGRALVPVGGMVVGALLLLVGIQAKEPLWTVFWLCLAQAAIGATEAPQWTTAVELGGKRGAMAAGIFNTGGNLGGAPAPYLTPLLSSLFGWKWGIAVCSIVCLVGASLWFWIDPRERVGETKR